ncbi:MAG: response regulator, partial [Anaerolineales bacterium]|nr:response regulator [Anaerolineales bacterium]
RPMRILYGRECLVGLRQEAVNIIPEGRMITMPLRILVVDDENINLRLVSRLIEMEGYEVVSAQSGEAALRLIEQTAPDLALLDVMMPVMDGYELCRRLRQNPVTAQIPIVMLTALVDENDRLKGIEAGADDCFPKPFDVDVLRTMLKRFLLDQNLGGMP